MCSNPVFVKAQSAFVPCRKCLECRLERAKEWAVRCYFEAQKTPDDNAFLTLTYDKAHNPGVLSKREIQLFMKRFRKALDPVKVKFFACGEYGPRTFRPHYHIIIFGYRFPDRRYHSRSDKGHPIFVSKLLSDCWPFGFHTVQDVSVNTAVYCALYAAKAFKAIPRRISSRVDFCPEFNLMSQGIGVDEIAKKIDVYLETDEIYIDGKRYRIPNAVLRKLYVDYDEDGRIVGKDQVYLDLKEKRQSDYEKNHAEECRIVNDLIEVLPMEPYHDPHIVRDLLAKQKAYRDLIEEKQEREKLRARCIRQTLD